ncbi:hypothetical protein HOU02_gp315 [Caulobacter phage CcrBL9]|uniref:Uncharacterized protein n=1 Tax=Caulobacter phage CcrBL9 TaxID=2283270 RepID=A0A385ECN4_9CAUD|nr:hypothetical protein HOU02_gp315 [Caulobacter phage CcrBL9]AXQ69410.1 hypothetical protein CcrBL9_gp386 [Caulobacter phage CcrBL9]
MSQDPLNLFSHRPILDHGEEPALSEIIETYYAKHGLAADRAAQVAHAYMSKMSSDIQAAVAPDPRDDNGHQLAHLSVKVAALLKLPAQLIAGDRAHIAAVKLYNAIQSGDQDEIFAVLREIKEAFPAL